MTTHEVTYEGPASFAVRAAAIIADADGIELTSATREQDPHGTDETVALVLTLEATDEAVAAAVAAVRAELPGGATIG